MPDAKPQSVAGAPVTEMIEKHILRKFEITNRLGKGAYGVVWKAIDKKSRFLCAIKKCFECFRTPIDAQRTFREILYLTCFNDHDNIIKLRHVIKAESNKDLYVTFDFVDCDLHAVSRARILTEIQRKYIIWQLARAVKYIHSAEVIHRDIKPSNILIDGDCHLRLCDFGLARSTGANYLGPPVCKTEYLATRWYRAPEMLLASQKYGKAVDVWGIGLVLGELILGSPVFPGLSVMNQIERIIELTQMPTSADIKAINSKYAAIMIESIPHGTISYKHINEVFPTASPDAIDIMRCCLLFNPDSRPFAHDILKHAYCVDFHNESDEPDYPFGQLILPLDDNLVYTCDEYRDCLYKEMTERRREMRHNEKERHKRAVREAQEQDPEEGIRPASLEPKRYIDPRANKNKP